MSDAERGSGDRWMTLAEIADELRVNPATVRQWVSKGQLKASRAGLRKWIVRRSDLEQMLAQTNPAGAEAFADASGPPARSSRRPEHGQPSGGGEPSRPAPARGATSNAAKLVQYAGESFERALNASAYAPPSPGYLDRMWAIADACEHVSATVLHASQAAGIRWRGLASFGPDRLPYEIRPGGNRPWREGLWDEFDAAVDTLSIAMTGHDMTAVAEGFREVGQALIVVAQELEQDASWQTDSQAT